MVSEAGFEPARPVKWALAPQASVSAVPPLRRISRLRQTQRCIYYQNQLSAQEGISTFLKSLGHSPTENFQGNGKAMHPLPRRAPVEASLQVATASPPWHRHRHPPWPQGGRLYLPSPLKASPASTAFTSAEASSHAVFPTVPLFAEVEPAATSCFHFAKFDDQRI